MKEKIRKQPSNDEILLRYAEILYDRWQRHHLYGVRAEALYWEGKLDTMILINNFLKNRGKK